MSDDPIQGAGTPSGDEPEAVPRVILVDGFNVLHAVLLENDRSAGWWRRKHRERLLERLCDWRGGPDQIWVAFDGSQPRESVWAEPVAIVRPGERKGPTIHSIFVESADDWIVRRARNADDPTRTIVVSADRQVAGRARSAGCEILTPWTFMGGCGPARTS
jgi:predicted RNA-binding protein with PIN domain